MALTDGLISVWHMNNDWQDSWGTNHGMPSGAIFSTDAKLGSHCGSFDAVNDGVACGTVLNVTTEFTYHAWIKRVSINKNSYIMHKNPVNTVYAPVFYISSSNFLSFFLQDIGVIIASDSTITDTTAYHHLIVSRNTSNIYKMYIDGIFHKQVTNTNTPAINSLTFYLGHITLGLGAKFDEAAVWSRALTDGGVSVGQLAGEDVGELYNNGAGVELWRLSSERILRCVNRGITRGL